MHRKSVGSSVLRFHCPDWLRQAVHNEATRRATTASDLIRTTLVKTLDAKPPMDSSDNGARQKETARQDA